MRRDTKTADLSVTDGRKIPAKERNGAPEAGVFRGNVKSVKNIMRICSNRKSYCKRRTKNSALYKHNCQ